MAEIRPFQRALAPAIEVVRPARAARRLQRLLRSLNLWFWAIVGLPTLVAGVYFFGIAANLYLSEAQFIVRSPKHAPVTTIGALLQTTGLSQGQDDTAAVEDFIMSRDAVKKLELHDNLRAVFNRPEGDFVMRFPGILGRSDFEALYWRYGHFVSVETDSETGVTTLKVKAFRAADAQRIAAALLHYSEALVNQLNERARRDTLATARREVEREEARITHIQDQLTAYRVRERIIDPKTASAGLLGLIAQMMTAQTNARAQLAELLKDSPASPQIPLVKNRIESLDQLISEDRAKLAGRSNSVVASLTQYERLTMQRLLAEKTLASAFASLEAARLEAQRQQLYVEEIAQPNLADYPLYPKRVLSFAMVFVSCFLVYGLAWLLVAAVREHAAG
jgi:capsular polysaccharide transport system permease protein